MTSAEPNPSIPAVEPEPGCPFCGILAGTEAGTIIARDEERRFALIQSIHPESNVHWMAIPYEHVPGTETMENADGKRFLDLMNFAISEVRARREEYPQLYRGFSIKMHFGSFETIEHAKIHVLAAE